MEAPWHRYLPNRQCLIGLLVILPVLGWDTKAGGEERQQRSSPAALQRSPQTQTFMPTNPGQGSMPTFAPHVQQYTPPGLNPGSGTHPIQNNPPGLQGSPNPNSPTMAMPSPLGSPASPPGAPGPEASRQGASGLGGWGPAYPVGYQSPSALQPPYGYQGQPAYARQFTCRTAHYYCIVPYGGACQCENDRERERGATID